MTIVHDEQEPIKHRTNFVEGPGGFTESFDDGMVDLLVRMGLIKWVKTTSAYGWETKVYRAPGMEDK